MKKIMLWTLSAFLLAGLFSGCGNNGDLSLLSGTQIQLSDEQITVDGQPVSAKSGQAVYAANDIIYYEEGHDFTYGEGGLKDAHSSQEANAHTVVHITQPGQYVLSGKLSKGQIAVDLGEDAKKDSDAVVTLVLNGVDITCQVAPAIIFYEVYECGDKDSSRRDVDTSDAGANVVIADGSVNNVTGAYVAKIYKPNSVELSKDGTEVEDAKKLHKYDGAFYSKMSMNVDGGSKGDGVLNIIGSNEGMDTELHLTINGGNINIVSGNDGINTNEDGVSVTTINGGSVNIRVDGSTGEGDGIDSNGYLVINGGCVVAQACAFSSDAGIDSDLGIHINGGRVFATGNMLDRIEESRQNYAVFTFLSSCKAETYSLKNDKDEIAVQQNTENDFTYLIISDESLKPGAYSLWQGDTQLQVMQSADGGMMGPGGMGKPEGMERPEDMVPPEGMKRPEGAEPFEDMTPPEGMENPGDWTPSQSMEDRRDPGKMQGGFFDPNGAAASSVFTLQKGANYFQVIQF